MFHKLPLSLNDALAIGVCGFAESFFKAAPAPIQVRDEFTSFATTAIEFATFEATVAVTDANIESLLDGCDFAPDDEDFVDDDFNSTQLVPPSSIVRPGMLSMEVNQVVEVSVNKRKRESKRRCINHALYHGNKSRCHKKKSTGMVLYISMHE